VNRIDLKLKFENLKLRKFLFRIRIQRLGSKFFNFYRFGKMSFFNFEFVQKRSQTHQRDFSIN
jgi:hypothetical protein